MSIQNFTILLFFAVSSFAAEPAATAVSSFHPEQALPRDVLTNEGVVALADAGYSPRFVMDRIRLTTRTHFDTTVDGLTYLRRNGIPEEVVEFLLNPTKDLSSTAPAPMVFPGKPKFRKLTVRIPRVPAPSPVVYIYYGGGASSPVAAPTSAPAQMVVAVASSHLWWR